MDTYAWVEYLIGSAKGETVRKLFRNEAHEFLTAESSLSELRGWALREKKDFGELFSVVKTNSHIEAVYLEDWLEAADVKSAMRKDMPDFGLMDALLVAKQKRHGGKIVSGDPHFKDMKNVVYLK